MRMRHGRLLGPLFMGPLCCRWPASASGAAARRTGPRFPFDRLSDRIERGFAFKHEGTTMRVSDILKVKGNTLFTVTPDKPLREAVDTMAEHDIGSLVVMEYGDLVGMLTFREIILRLHVNGGAIGDVQVRKVMDEPLTCTPETDVNEVRRMMLERHARYMPVLDKKVLMGVISFYDVAKTVVEAQSFENRMLKAYIRDWPESEAEAHKS
ncbi:CBS domain-containing protein [Burkholderia cepacia]|nr:CBS domain-containing protein [Burkholderia cepacia]